jgi:hypothetical protein
MEIYYIVNPFKLVVKKGMLKFEKRGKLIIINVRAYKSR